MTTTALKTSSLASYNKMFYYMLMTY